METPNEKVIVRMAPSPTGNLHIGTARTTLFNYLFAKKFNGKFILRIEDTDKERSTKEFEKNILDGLAWLGFNFDEFARQSERTEIYKAYVEKLIEDGHAYVSKENPKEEGQRSEVIRFKNPRKKIKFEDLIRGEVEFDTTELGDFVIAKDKKEPLYHLAVVVDDHQMGVTHIIRGEDHISNTPRQILIQEAIGAKRPIYAHLPLILDPDRKKLSKRKHGEAVWIDYYKKEGYLPEAIVNFLAFLGWNPGTYQEIFSMQELIEAFTIEGLQKSGAIYNPEKLRWFNKEHIKRMPAETLERDITLKLNKRYPNKAIHPKIITLITERIEILGDIDRVISSGEFDYFFDRPDIDKEKINWRGENSINTKKYLQKVIEIIEKSEGATEEYYKSILIPYAEEVGKGNVLWPLRFSLSGREKSPDPFTLISVLGKEETLNRIKSTIEVL